MTLINHHYQSSPLINTNTSSPLININTSPPVITQHHSTPLITSHHHSPPHITTHHHSPPHITTHHHSSPPGTGTVVVRLADVNDNSPRLSRDLWAVEVDETRGEGPPDDLTLLQITTNDKDTSNYFYYRVRGCCSGSSSCSGSV